MTQKKDFIGKEATFVSKSTTLPVGMKRFDKGPYFDFYHKEDNLYGVYAERFYPISLGNDTEEMYWNLRRKAVMYDTPEKPIQIQGPKSQEILSKLTNGSLDENFKYYHSGFFDIAGQKVYISRTGWTAELGYEIYSLGGDTNYKKLWNTILEIGKPLGLHFDGILSMEMRRIEGGILDSNTDFDSSMNPFEAGLGRLVDLDKDDFIGKKALEELSKKSGKRLFGIISEKAFKYKSNVFLSNDEIIGYLPASTWSPTLKKYIGYVRFNYSGKWTDFKVRAESLDDNFIDCEVVELPFYDKDKLIPRGKDTTIP